MINHTSIFPQFQFKLTFNHKETRNDAAEILKKHMGRSHYRLGKNVNIFFANKDAQVAAAGVLSANGFRGLASQV